MTSSKTQPEISHGFKKRFLVDEECYEAEGFKNSTFKRATGKVPKAIICANMRTYHMLHMVLYSDMVHII